MPIRLPAAVHRLALIVAHRARIAWWRLSPRELQGCNVVVSDASGAVLLVRHSYQQRQWWMLPGGGIASGESVEAAAIREVREETGCRLVDVRGFGVDHAWLAGCHNHVHLLAGTTFDRPRPDRREIVAARFFPADGLPDGTAAAARARIERWKRWQAAQPPRAA